MVRPIIESCTITQNIKVGEQITGKAVCKNYKRVEWKIDGKLIGKNLQLIYQINSIGTYTVTFYAIYDYEVSTYSEKVTVTANESYYTLIDHREQQLGQEFRQKIVQQKNWTATALFKYERGNWEAAKIVSGSSSTEKYVVVNLNKTDQYQVSIIIVNNETGNTEFGGLYYITVYDPNDKPEGSGKEADPYLIKNRSQLMYIKTQPSGNFKLMNDIEVGTWYTAYAFTGTFDGNGYELWNMYVIPREINRGTPSYTVYGLWGLLLNGAKILHLGITNSVIELKDISNNIIIAGFCTGILEYGAQVSPNIINECWFNGEIVDKLPETDNNITIYAGFCAGFCYDNVGYRKLELSNIYCYGKYNIDRENNTQSVPYVGGLIGKITSTVKSNNIILRNNITNVNIFLYDLCQKSIVSGIVGYVDGKSGDKINIFYNVSRATQIDGYYRIVEWKNDLYVVTSNDNYSYDNMILRKEGDHEFGDDGEDKNRYELSISNTYIELGFDFESIWKLYSDGNGLITPILQCNKSQPKLYNYSVLPNIKLVFGLKIPFSNPLMVSERGEVLFSGESDHYTSATWYDVFDGSTNPILDVISGSVALNTLGVHSLYLELKYNDLIIKSDSINITVVEYDIEVPPFCLPDQAINLTSPSYILDQYELQFIEWFVKIDDKPEKAIGGGAHIQYIPKSFGIYTFRCYVTHTETYPNYEEGKTIAFEDIKTCICDVFKIIKPLPTDTLFYIRKIEFALPDNITNEVDWNFGDGITEHAKSPINHKYESAGKYNVVVTNGDVSASVLINVLEKIELEIQPQLKLVYINQETELIAVTNASPSTFEWDFGDGSEKGYGSIVKHKFNGEKGQNIRIECKSTFVHSDGYESVTLSYLDVTLSDIISNYQNADGNVFEFTESCYIMDEGRSGFSEVQLSPTYISGGNSYRGQIYTGNEFLGKTILFSIYLKSEIKEGIVESYKNNLALLIKCYQTSGIGKFTFLRDDNKVFYINCTPVAGYPKINETIDGAICQLAFFASVPIWYGETVMCEKKEDEDSIVIDYNGDIPCGISGEIDSKNVENVSTGKGLYSKSDKKTLKGCIFDTSYQHMILTKDGDSAWDRLAISSGRIELKIGENIIKGCKYINYNPLFLGV